MTVIQDTATDSSGSPIKYANVSVTLLSGSLLNPGATAGAPSVIRADSGGNWSVDLAPNSAGTFYQVANGSAVKSISVPAFGGPYSLSQVPAPALPAPAAPMQVAVGGLLEAVRPEVNLVAGTNVTLTGADNPGSGRVDVTIAASGPGPWQFNVTAAAYGARGDGQVVTDGAMSSVTNTTTLACTTSTPFTSADVGKAIMVVGAAAAGVTSLVTTIASVTDPGHVVLNAACSTTVSGAKVLWATDDTAAFQGAVNDAVTYAQTHGGYGEVVIPAASKRFYGIAGALSHTNSGNAQITLPVISTAADCVTLAFVGTQSGSAIRHWLQTTPQLGGSCLVSFGVYQDATHQINDINPNGQSAMIGGPTGPNGYGTSTFLFSNMLVVLKGLSLVTTYSSNGLGYGAAWLWGVDQCNVIDLGYGTTGVYNNGAGELGSVSALATGASVGFGLPATSNQNNVSWDRVTCGGGYTYGVLATEHSVLNDSHIFYCWAGLCPVGSWHDGSATANTSSHKIKFPQIGIEGCTHSLFVLGAGAGGVGPFMEGCIDAESGMSWADDGNNGLADARGEIHLTGTTGGTLTTSTGTNLTIIDERQANGPGTAWSLTVGTAKQNTQWRWATVILSGGTSLTAVQLGNSRGGGAAPTMTSCYTQSAASLVPLTVRVPPGGWLQVNGTGSPTAPTATVVYD